MPIADLIGVTDIARFLGVSRQQAHSYTKREDFPPASHVSNGRLWRAKQVQKWVDQQGKKWNGPRHA